MRRRGFTDKLYFVNLLFAWVFTVACFVLTIFSGQLAIPDMSICSVGLGVVWGEVSIHSAFIIWKAKSENISKNGNNDNITM